MYPPQPARGESWFRIRRRSICDPWVLVSKKPIEIDLVQHTQAMTPIFRLTVNLA